MPPATRELGTRTSRLRHWGGGGPSGQGAAGPRAGHWLEEQSSPYGGLRGTERGGTLLHDVLREAGTVRVRLTGS